MKWNTTLVLVSLAMLIGIAVGMGGGYQLGYDADHRWKIVTIPVADKEIPRGTIITEPEKLFVPMEVWLWQVPRGAITDTKKLKGMQTVLTIDPGAVCTQRCVTDFENLACGTRQPSHRAVTVCLRIQRALVPYLVPGNHVDVLAVMPDANRPSGTIASVVLREAVVLGPEGGIQIDKNGNASVTLGMKPEDAEKWNRIVGDDRIAIAILPSKLEEKGPESGGN